MDHKIGVLVWGKLDIKSKELCLGVVLQILSPEQPTKRNRYLIEWLTGDGVSQIYPKMYADIYRTKFKECFGVV